MSRHSFIGTANKLLVGLAIGIFLLVGTGLCAPYTNFHIAFTGNDIVDLKLLYPWNGSTLYTFALLQSGDIKIYRSQV